MSGRDSLDAAYFDGIFSGDPDPWALSSSPYEAAKFAHTCEVLADRRYSHALEVGCAQGVLTGKLAALCERLLALDISPTALARARIRLAHCADVRLQQMAFPRETPSGSGYDLVVLSEVVYYWSDEDIDRAARWISDAVVRDGRVVLVHYTEPTDYPQSGDAAAEMLGSRLQSTFESLRAERRDHYRLDLWVRR